MAAESEPADARAPIERARDEIARLAEDGTPITVVAVMGLIEACEVLESENARLYEGWPGKDQRASVYHTDEYADPAIWPYGIPEDISDIPCGWYVYRGMLLDEVGPHGTRREAILAYCDAKAASAHRGLDAPAGGGE